MFLQKYNTIPHKWDWYSQPWVIMKMEHKIEPTQYQNHETVLEAQVQQKQPGFNNFEQNIYNALHNLPTRTNVAVLVVVHQTMSIPYARSMRDESLNATDLGPLHVAVKDLCHRIADDLSFVLQDLATSRLQCAL